MAAASDEANALVQACGNSEALRLRACSGLKSAFPRLPTEVGALGSGVSTSTAVHWCFVLDVSIPAAQASQQRLTWRSTLRPLAEPAGVSTSMSTHLRASGTGTSAPLH
jgi:hypothetical protein